MGPKKRTKTSEKDEEKKNQIEEFIKVNFMSPIDVKPTEDIMKISLFNQIEVVRAIPYSCDDVDVDIFPKIIQQLRYQDRECSPGTTRIIYGYAGEVSIAKVRGATFDSFCRALLFLATDPRIVQYGMDTIITSKGKEQYDFIFMVQIPTIPPLNFRFSYNKLSSVFETRSDLKNEITEESDITMIKILALLNYLLLNTTERTRKNDIRKIIDSIGLVASSKQVLDIGALYAILEPTFNLNQVRKFMTSDIVHRLGVFESSVQSLTLTAESYNTFIETTYVEVESLPRNAVLETADGSASTIAGKYFTILSDVAKGLGRPTPFMNVDRVFSFIMILITNDDFYTKVFITHTYTPDVKGLLDSVKIKIDFLRILYNLPTSLTIKQQAFMIDIFYSLIDTMSQSITETDDITTEETTDSLFNKIIFIHDLDNDRYSIRIKQIFFDLFSTSKFLYMSKDGIDRMKRLLMACNFDSQCHDNGKCKFYRLICIYYFLLYCTDYKEAWTILTGRDDYWTILSAAENIQTDIIDPKKDAVITEYGSAFDEYGSAFDSSGVVIDNFVSYIDVLLCNFDDNKKLLFYELALLGYDEIEQLLNQRLIHTCDIVLSEKDNPNIVIVSPFRAVGQPSYPLIREVIQDVPPQIEISADLIPEDSNVSIDLGIHWTVSALKDYRITSRNRNSELIFTPVSYSDAASNRMYSTATYIDDPIKMPLYRYGIVYVDEPYPLCGYTFIKSTADKTNIVYSYADEETYLLTDNKTLNDIIKVLKEQSFINEETVQDKVNEFITLYNYFGPSRAFNLTFDIRLLPGFTGLNQQKTKLIASIITLLQSQPDTSRNFYNIFKSYFNNCVRFQNERTSPKKTKNSIKSYNFPSEIETIIQGLIIFFTKTTPSINTSGRVEIDSKKFSDYSKFLTFLINAISGTAGNPSRSLYELIKTKEDADARAIQPIRDLDTGKSKPKRPRRGGNGNSILTLEDFIGPYGSYLYINDKGTFSIDPINTEEKLVQLQTMFKKLYNVEERKVYNPPKTTNIISQDKIIESSQITPSPPKNSVDITVKQPIVAKGPSGPSKEFLEGWLNLIRNNEIYKKLPKEKQNQKIEKIMRNITKMKYDNKNNIDIKNYILSELSLSEFSPTPIKSLSPVHDAVLNPVQYQPQAVSVNTGGRKTRKNRNKLTRKKYRKVKARKTRHRYKKNRYTRHKK